MKTKTIKFTKITTGHYKYKFYEIVKWKPEQAGIPYLWCLAIDGVGMDDFKTLAKVRQHIVNEEKKWESFDFASLGNERKCNK